MNELSEKYTRILIVRLSALGDAALTLPLVFALRRIVPGAYIGWVVSEAVAPLLENISQIDQIHVWKKDTRNPIGLWRLSQQIKARRYQASIDPQGLTISALIPLLAGIKQRVGFAPGLLECRELARFFTNQKITPPGTLQHISSRTLYLGLGLGLQMPQEMPIQLPIHPMAASKIEDWWRQHDIPDKTIVFGIGAGWQTKIWPPNEMALIVRAAVDQGYCCIILWGPDEKDDIVGWRALLPKNVLWAPLTDISAMIELLRRSERYAGPDSSALHLASLLGKPTFSWFGASDPMRCAPRGHEHAFIEKGPHNWNRKRMHPSGLQSLTGNEVLPAFGQWLLQ